MRYFDWTYQKSILVIVIAFPCFLFAQNKLNAEHSTGHEELFQDHQEERRISITQLSNLSFGAFYPGQLGGSIEITKNGTRSSSGSVILLHSELNASAAVFEIKCPSNTMIHVMIDPIIELQDQSNGTIRCEPIFTEPTQFVSPNNAESGFLYSIGAKLTIQDASFESPGKYSGRFNVFILLE
ncbi:MAG: DUF4402 domain-containing protein [Fluviicola sp.]|nr:DUF4402 domain-containing protein [Fluviicola sp.]